MERKAVSEIMLTLLLLSPLVLLFNTQMVKATPNVVLSDKEIIPNPPYTSGISFTITVETPTTTRIWFQIKASFNETDYIFSTCAGWGERLDIQDSRRLTIIFVDEPYPPSQTIQGDIIYMDDLYWFNDLPSNWVYGITTVYDSWKHALTGYFSEIKPNSMPARVTVTSLPITGITYTVNASGFWRNETTPYTEWLPEGSYTFEMPETHNGYIWSHWLEDEDPNRIKTIAMDANITLTAIYTPVSSPVAGDETPVSPPVAGDETIPVIGAMVALPIAVAVASFKYRTKKKS